MCPPFSVSMKWVTGESSGATEICIPPCAITLLESPNRNFVARITFDPAA